MQELITFQTGATIEDITEVADKLRGIGIKTEILKSKGRLDTVFIGTEYTDKYELKIPADDFTRANKLLYNTEQITAADLDTHHPLYGMSNDELKDILGKPDEWGPENYNFALALLKSRGVQITDNLLSELHDERINVLSEKKSMNFFPLLIGYATAILPFIMIVLKNKEIMGAKYTWYFPGFLGLLIGLVILQSKTTLPDGRRIPTFNNRTLKHAIVIVGLNILAWIVYIILLIYVL